MFSDNRYSFSQSAMEIAGPSITPGSKAIASNKSGKGETLVYLCSVQIRVRTQLVGVSLAAVSLRQNRCSCPLYVCGKLAMQTLKCHSCAGTPPLMPCGQQQCNAVQSHAIYCQNVL